MYPVSTYMDSWRKFPLLQAWAKGSTEHLESLKYVLCSSGITVSYLKSQRHVKLCLVATLIMERFLYWERLYLSSLVG